MFRKLFCYLPVLSSLLLNTAVTATTWVACPGGSTDSRCQFRGNQAIQHAVDAAGDGDFVLIKAGSYSPDVFQDTPYNNDTERLVIRGYITIANKRISITGEKGVILDGSRGPASSAIVVTNASVDISKLIIRNFRAASAEDDLYDGHGIFLINSQAKIREVVIDGIAKMGLSIRQNSIADVINLQVINSHLGIWIREKSRLHLRNSLVGNIDGAGIAAYSASSSLISNSVFFACRDDGIYSSEDAKIAVTNSVILNSKPHGIAADGNSRIEVDYSVVYGNDKNYQAVSANSRVETDRNIFVIDPKLDNRYLPLPGSPVIDKGHPDIRDPDGSRSDIGLYQHFDI